METNPAQAKSKQNWNKLYQVILDQKSQIPVKQMALKVKHQSVIFDQIYANFAKGKSISGERKKLATLSENMRFKGGPMDRSYARKCNRPITLIPKEAKPAMTKKMQTESNLGSVVISRQTSTAMGNNDTATAS